ncbi:VOC family protein [Nocardioides solisilvae]|uniref:VOC family protein n=1 Tax=Nocardioides solisilvae TaxID=1542435 RepID=UPI000D745DCF|nr:VOC family protein [Nocardioides solisilvae]
MPSTVTWLSAFLDLPAGRFDEAVAFWQGVTGYDLSRPRGASAEFATLLPPDADDHLRVQRLAEGGPRIHLDLHVADPRQAADEAVRLGATEVADHGYVVLRSPGGLTFCFVGHQASRPAAPATWHDDGHDDGKVTDRTWRSAVDQVCLDVPRGVWEPECRFWAAVLGSDWQPTPPPGDFRGFRPVGALHVLAQRLEEADGEVRAHLDLSCDDVPAEVRRHLALGARVEAEHAQWTVLRDPAGSPYCITVRRPG